MIRALCFSAWLSLMLLAWVFAALHRFFVVMVVLSVVGAPRGDVARCCDHDR